MATWNMNGVVHIHNVAASFGNVKNLVVDGRYADRSILLPGAATVLARDGTDVTKQLAFYHSVGIGPQEVMVAEDLYDTEGAWAADVRRMFAEDPATRLSFFHVGSEREEAVAQALGIAKGHWEQRVLSPPLSVAVRANNKKDLRVLGARLGMQGVFPEHIATADRSEAEMAANRMLKDGPVIIKRPDSASGNGLIVIAKDVPPADPRFRTLTLEQRAGRAIEEVLQESEWVIVEREFLPHLPISIQLFADDVGVHWVCATVQIMDGDNVSHMGNITAWYDREPISEDARDTRTDSFDSGLPGVSPSDVWHMWEMARPFAEVWWREGFRGPLGFDFLKTPPGVPEGCPSGRVYLLECNGRVTATTYAVGVAKQVYNNVGNWPRGVASMNFKPGVPIPDFQALVEALRNVELFGGRIGVLPFFGRFLPEKAGIMAVAGGEERGRDAGVGNAGVAMRMLFRAAVALGVTIRSDLMDLADSDGDPRTLQWRRTRQRGA